MHQGKQQSPIGRRKWLGAATFAVVATTLILFALFGLRGPGAVAREFLEALLRMPEDYTTLRKIANLGESDDPRSLIEGVSTRVTLDFLRARARQGVVLDVSVAESRRPEPGRYAVILRVLENADGGSSRSRRFQVRLQRSDAGDWRIISITTSDWQAPAPCGSQPC